MKYLMVFVLCLLFIPLLSFAQLKKDVTPTNISNTLNSLSYNNPYLGFLDPSKFHMTHGFSMSYMSMGGYGMMLNSYINTINYKFNENLFLTTKLGIMNSPYNSLPSNSAFNDVQFFGGAELKYLPSDNSAIIFRFESTPMIYPYTNSYYYRSPLGLFNRDW